MKAIKYTLLAILAAAVTFTSCNPMVRDIFPTDPVAPVVDSHSDILITNSTMDEELSFTWTKARYCEVASYELYVAQGEYSFCIAKGLKETNYSTTKKAFNDFIKAKFWLDENVSVSLQMYAVAVTTDGKSYTGENTAVNVYSCGNVVAPVAKACSDALVLNIDDPTSKIDLVTWEAARFGYNVTPLYAVMLKVGSKDAYQLASGISDNFYSLTTDALNDAVVAAGGTENVATPVDITIVASAEGYPDISSRAVTVSITTYVATFPEKVYLPGNYQGWVPATAPTINVSTVVKGLYEGFVDLTTSAGEDCLFKFCIKPDWGDDFAIDNISVKSETGGYVSVSGSGITANNISVPSGVYWIKMSKKFKTLQMVQINELNLIGDFCSWDVTKEITLSLDPATHSFVSDNSLVLTEDQSGTGYKVRFNKQWEWSLGSSWTTTGTEYFSLGGDNAKMTLKKGKYDFKLDCNSNPVVPKFVSLDMPETLLLAGDYSGHTWTGENAGVNIYLKDADKGIYKGYVTMMYTVDPQTWGFKVVKNGTTWIGTSSAAAGPQYNLVDGGGENMKPANNNYYVETDMINLTLKLTTITSVGIIGSFNSWGSDVLMAYDAVSMTWSCNQAFVADDQFKFRFNGTWDYNLGTGGSGDNGLIHEGGNIMINEAGTYHIVLDMHNTPTFTITK